MLETRLSDWDGVEIGTSELRNYKRVQGGETSFNEEPFLIVRGQIRHRFPNIRCERVIVGIKSA